MAGTDLGTRLKRAREAKGWTQEELADRLPRRPDGRRGASVRSIGSWERGVVPRSALGALEVVLAPYFTVNGIPAPPPTDPVERKLWDLAIQDTDAAGAWEVIEEYRRVKRRTA